MKIRYKLFTLIIPTFFVIMILSYFVSTNTANNILDGEIDARIANIKEVQKTSIESSMNGANQIAEDVSALVNNTYQHETLSAYEDILESIVTQNALILGVGIWFEPYAYDVNEKFVGPYVYKNNDTITTTYEYSNEKYNYLTQDFYTLAKDKMKMVFTDVYYDETSNLYMMTCAKPLIGDLGQFIGCVTVDIEISMMKSFVSEYNAGKMGKMSIINSSGAYLAAENIDLVRNNNNIINTNNKEFQAIASQILANNSGETYYENNNKRINVYYDTLNLLDWKVVFEIPDSIMHQPLYALSQIYAIIFGISLLFLFYTLYLISKKSIDHPVKLLQKELKLISSSEFESEIDRELLKRKDEFGLIAVSLSKMKQQLNQNQYDLQNYLEENIAANEELSQQNEELIDNGKLIMNSLHYSNSLIEAIPDPVFVISNEGVFLDFKGDLNRLFMPKEVFLGKSLHEVMPLEIANKGMNAIYEVNQTGTTQKIEYEWPLDDETEYHEMHMAQWYDDKVIAITRNITETRKYIREIEHVGYHDTLTGLFNRSYFDKQFRALTIAGNYPIGIVISGLNGLKMINDSFGHSQGDAMLQKYASILNKSSQDHANCREVLVCRISGDEFAVVMPQMDAEKGQAYIRDLNHECNISKVNGIDLSVAFGYCIIEDETMSLQTAMKKAEDNMYQSKLFESSSRRSKTVDIILSTLHEKNPREESHSRRVAELCEMMARKLNFGNEEVKRIKAAGILHDIGKIGVSEELLNKETALTKEEYLEICKHSEIGYRILSTAPNMTEISEIVLAHHERWDGNGYPKGIKGEEIPSFSRIIAIVDAYDAMTSDRSYRKALSATTAVEELKKYAGTQFDPDLTAFFIQNIAYRGLNF